MPITLGKRQESDYTNPLGLLNDCHRRIESFLQVLVTVTGQARGLDLNHDQRNGLETALRYFREAAPNHTLDEEDSLFPRMRALSHPPLQEALATLDSLHTDHQVADEIHREVDALGSRWLTQGRLSEVRLSE